MAQYGGAIGVAHAPVIAAGGAWLEVRNSDGDIVLAVQPTSSRTDGGYSTTPPYESDSYAYSTVEVEARVNGSTVSFPVGEIRTSHEVYDPGLGHAIRQKVGHTFELAWRLGTLSGSDHLPDGALRFLLDGVEVINESGLALGRVSNADWERVTIYPDGAIRAVYVRDIDEPAGDFGIAEEEEPFSAFLSVDTSVTSHVLYSANFTSAVDADVFSVSGGFWDKAGTVTLEDGYVTSLGGSISYDFAPTALAKRGSFVAGESGTVKATRAALFSLDGAVNENATPGLFKIAGDLEVTGTTTFGGRRVMPPAATTITQAQLLTLPTTPIDIVPAQGPNTRIEWDRIAIVANTTAGAFTNIDPAGYLVALLGGDEVSNFAPNDPSVGESLTHLDRLLGGNHVYMPLIPWTGISAAWGPLPTIWDVAGQVNVPLQLWINNDTSGDLTGGDPDDTFTVTVFWSVVDVP